MNAVTVETPEERRDRLQREGVLGEEEIAYLLRSAQPGGEQRRLDGESCRQAVARLMHHYGWDEPAAQHMIALSEGWSDLTPENDDGNPLPYFRVRDDIEAAEADLDAVVTRP